MGSSSSGGSGSGDGASTINREEFLHRLIGRPMKPVELSAEQSEACRRLRGDLTPMERYAESIKPIDFIVSKVHSTARQARLAESQGPAVSNSSEPFDTKAFARRLLRR